MNEERITEALAAYIEQRVDRSTDEWTVDLTEKERDQLVPLIQLADRLEEHMRPVQPSPAFVRSLRGELVEEAGRRMARRKRRQRVAMIGAAVVGSVVSIASLVGGIVVLVKWLRTRAQTRHAPAS